MQRSNEMASQMLNKTCFVDFPYEVEAKVMGIMDESGVWRLSRKHTQVKNALSRPWQQQV